MAAGQLHRRVTQGRGGGGQRASRSRAGAQGSRASRAGLHIRACSGAVTGYSMQGRGYMPKAPRQPQGAIGGLFSWGYVWGLHVEQPLREVKRLRAAQH
jgi:hypothetical protein